ncbi:MAG: DNA methylase [Thermoplasmata archaeon]|nr:MAG: DNA methylase [Thermoplasmata archaeon]
MKKKELELLLEKLEKPREPKAELEQYTTPSSIAADILFFAHMMGDIEGCVVADLGCGAGVFAIGASILGAREVYAVDVDKEMLSIAAENAKKAGVLITLLHMDVKDFDYSVDTVIQNPPFGAQKKHADRQFLDTGIRVAKVIYTMHNSNTEDFVTSYLEGKGARITHKKHYKFPIHYTFHFHKKERMVFDVVLIRAVRDDER